MINFQWILDLFIATGNHKANAHQQSLSRLLAPKMRIAGLANQLAQHLCVAVKYLATKFSMLAMIHHCLHGAPSSTNELMYAHQDS